MTVLKLVFFQYCATAQSDKEKGSYFENLIRTYLGFEASYADLCSLVWLFGDWAKEIGMPQFGIVFTVDIEATKIVNPLSKLEI